MRIQYNLAEVATGKTIGTESKETMRRCIALGFKLISITYSEVSTWLQSSKNRQHC